MTETPARKPRPRRTFSAFGDVRRMPSEYEIVTHAQNWTLRQNRAAAFEQNPSSAPNLSMSPRANRYARWPTGRSNSVLSCRLFTRLAFRPTWPPRTKSWRSICLVRLLSLKSSVGWSPGAGRAL